MNTPESETLDLRIESHIDAFEESLAESDSTDVADFLPDRTDPLFHRIAAELIRVDIEMAWDAGTPKSLGDYLTILPELETDDQLRNEIAFEEYRQRCQHGQTVSLDEFSLKYNVQTSGWSTVVANKDETRAETDFDELAKRVPSKGQRWRDFEIIREIGRGALSRVLLARQTSLSSRHVVLKFAPKNLLEAEKLALLQHSNIVPVFSVYEDRDFHVFCMPYLGDQTILDAWSDQEAASRPEKEQHCVGVLNKLASAIQHAHEKGLLHNDIKPANVLWSEHQPMLLDFNLAANSASGDELQIGGTLPYMAPEALEGLTTGQTAVDDRSDIFSLGALMFELVTGQPPFGKHTTLSATSESRRQPKTAELESFVSPGFASIITKSLEPNPEDRYQTATELLTDVVRQQTNLPLRYAPNNSLQDRIAKWMRRHPRLTSTYGMVAISSIILAICLTAWMVREKYVRGLETEQYVARLSSGASQLFPELSSVGLDAIDVERATDAAERILSTYVSDDDEWRSSEIYQRLPKEQQSDTDDKISRLAFLASYSNFYQAKQGQQPAGHLEKAKRWHLVASRTVPESTPAMLIQKSQIYELSGNQELAKAAEQEALATAPSSATDLQMSGWLARVSGDTSKAKTFLERSCERDPHDFAKWFNLAQLYMDIGDWKNAAHCYTTCVALEPESALARYARGIARREIGKQELAIDDFTTFIKATTTVAQGRGCALLNRALAYKDLGDHKAALRDLDLAIAGGNDGTRPLLIRSRVKRALGDAKGANDDIKLAMQTTPNDALGWVARGVAKMSRQPAEALKDFEKAVELNPRSHSARRNIAYLLAERLERPNDAIAVLTDLVKDYPLDDAAFGGRGVLFARAGRYKEAIEDAKKIVSLDGGPRSMLQAACVYSMASKEDPELQDVAVSLLGASFKVQPGLVKLAVEDRDLNEIHDFAAFEELCEAAKRFAALPEAASAVQHTGL